MSDPSARLADVQRAILARAPESDIEPSLEQIREVMDLLADPQGTVPVIHLTGTNGKTSTARIVEAVCREHGLTTGLFTSPHLHDLRERIRIGGASIDAAAFVAAYDEVIPLVELVEARDGVRMNFFQTLVAMAYVAFADAPVHVAIVEVGLGGAWDATNVADGQVAVLTPIDIDHTRLLGPTVERIAVEKSGIVKPGAIAVSAVQTPPVGEILAERATLVGARICVEGIDFGVAGRTVAVGGQVVDLRGLAGDYPDLFVPLHGPHQASNVAVAVAAVEAFLGGAQRALDVDILRAALATVTSPGRLELVRRSPAILVDAAHNPHGMAALREALADAFSFTRLVGVVAIFADKDVVGMLGELEPALDHLVVTRNSSPRCLDPAELGQLAAEVFGEHRVHVASSLPDAIDLAVGLAEADGIGGGVLATGSVVTAADVRHLLGVTDS